MFLYRSVRVVWACSVVALLVLSTRADDGERVSHLPNQNDPQTVKELRCSACRSSEAIMKSHLADALEELKHHSPPDEASRHRLMAAAVDGTCEFEQRNVGLLRSTGAKPVTTEYQHELRDDFSGDLVKAVWITEIWADECFDTMKRMAGHFLDYALGKDRVEWCPVCKQVNAPFAISKSRRVSHSIRRDDL